MAFKHSPVHLQVQQHQSHRFLHQYLQDLGIQSVRCLQAYLRVHAILATQYYPATKNHIRRTYRKIWVTHRFRTAPTKRITGYSPLKVIAMRPLEVIFTSSSISCRTFLKSYGNTAMLTDWQLNLQLLGTQLSLIRHQRIC